jgi:pyrimidine operon attenuation protein/uracil phosphoribosyltransferase
MSKRIVLTSSDIQRTLARIAHEIVEQNKTTDHIILVGLHTRGVPIAERLASNIVDFERSKIPVGALDIS